MNSTVESPQPDPLRPLPTLSTLLAIPALPWHLLSHLTEHSSRSQLERYAFGFTGNRADAEDVVSEAFIKTALALHTVRNPIKPVTAKFLCRTIHNLAMDLLRHRQRSSKVVPPEQHLEVPEVADGDTTPSHDPRPDESVGFDQALTDAFMSMPPASRRVASLKFLQGWDAEEVAHRLGISRRTVDKHLENARRVLREHFPLGGGTDESN